MRSSWVKSLLCSAIFFSFLSVTAWPVQEKSSGSPDIDSVLDGITVDVLKKHLEFIAADDMEGREAGSAGSNKATEYIAKQFELAGLKPMGEKENGKQTYYQYFSFSGRRCRNTIGLLAGSDAKLKDEYVVIGAHNDAMGVARRGSGDTIKNGADDNGSGSTSVMALALAFSKLKPAPRRSILFMTFNAEEKGLIGSEHYAKNPVVPMAKHKAMVNLDMVGRNPDRPVDIDMGSSTFAGSTVSDMVQKIADGYGLKHKLVYGFQFSTASDQASFRTRGVPSLFFFTGLHKDYHTIGDHADKIAYNRMLLIVKTSGKLLHQLAGMDSIPSMESRGKK